MKKSTPTTISLASRKKKFTDMRKRKLRVDAQKAAKNNPKPKLSVVIPVYNSKDIVGLTIDETVLCGIKLGIPFEVIAVNDGSSDGSWEVLCNKVKQHGSKIVAIKLLRNFGQHSALFCGMSFARGEWVLTLDDDMQIHPKEITRLMAKASGEVDLVVGRFEQKQHGLIRSIGSNLVQKINQQVFGKPNGFTISSFRLIRRDVVDRILQYRTPFPYINGLMLLCSGNRINVLVKHRPRVAGRSGYGIKEIASLLMKILFTYSAYPLRVALALSMICSVASFSVGLYFIILKIIGDIHVEGWTTVVAMIAFFNSLLIMMLAMIGEYVLRSFRQVINEPAYHISDVYKHHLS